MISHALGHPLSIGIFRWKGEHIANNTVITLRRLINTLRVSQGISECIHDDELSEQTVLFL